MPEAGPRPNILPSQLETDAMKSVWSWNDLKWSAGGFMWGGYTIPRDIPWYKIGCFKRLCVFFASLYQLNKQPGWSDHCSHVEGCDLQASKFQDSLLPFVKMTLLHADICEHSERQKSKMADGRRCWVMGWDLRSKWQPLFSSPCIPLQAEDLENATGKCYRTWCRGEKKQLGLCQENVSQCASLNPGWWFNAGSDVQHVCCDVACKRSVRSMCGITKKCWREWYWSWSCECPYCPLSPRFARRWLHRLILRLFCDDHALFFCDRKKTTSSEISKRTFLVKFFFSAI